MVDASHRTAPGPLDDAGLRFLPTRLRSHVFVLPALVRNPPDAMLGMGIRYGGVVALSPGRIHLVTHPEGIRHVLQDRHTNYIKGPKYSVLEPLMGKGLLVSDGALWRRQRSLVQPAFQKKHHAAVMEAVTSATASMLQRWRSVPAGRSIDSRAELILLTLDILLKAVFGMSALGHEQKLRDAILAIESGLDLLQAVNPLKLPDWIPTPGRRRFRRAVGVLDEFIARIVNQRRQAGEDGQDLVSLLVRARDENGEPMDDTLLRDELVTMLQAGHDTVSDAIVWSWYLMATHTDAAAKVREEADRVLRDPAPALDDAAALTYTTRLVHEAMRLYPPAWVFGRTAVEDDEIGGYFIPKGSLVVVSPYVTHRLPQLWDSPAHFDPDRFTAERSTARPRFAYLPFGAGPRQCIGAGMAMLEAPVIIAMVARAFDLRLQPGQSVGVKPRISLMPDRKIWLTPVERR